MGDEDILNEIAALETERAELERGLREREPVAFVRLEQIRVLLSRARGRFRVRRFRSKP